MKREGLELWASLCYNLDWKSVGKVDRLHFHVAILRRLQCNSSYMADKMLTRKSESHALARGKMLDLKLDDAWLKWLVELINCHCT